jgi:glycolate oxidase iron-sulfur subunit
MRPHAPGFDQHRPPDPARIAECVHCGFCLASCPTYLLWHREPDSPRGRIDLMRSIHEGVIGLTPETVRYFDNCLGCLACETACPSGVQYGLLIEQTRAQIERHVSRPPGDRLVRWLIFQLFPSPERLRRLLPFLRLYRASGLRSALHRLGLLRLLPAPLQAMEALLPPLPPRGVAPLPEHTPAVGAQRLRVGLVSGCVQRVFFPQVNQATVTVLAAEGCAVVVPPQGCCGALEFHAGLEERARQRARALVAAFAATPLDRIVVNAAGCGATLKAYGALLAEDEHWAGPAARFAAAVRDISELLAELPPRGQYHPLPLRLAYQDACHLQHARRIRQQPRSVLQRIPGLDLVELEEAEICCGSAGVYNLVNPLPARELGDRKARQVLASGAAALASANPGCLLQIQTALARAGWPLPAYHPVELLAASLRGEPLARAGG